MKSYSIGESSKQQMSVRTFCKECVLAGDGFWAKINNRADMGSLVGSTV